MNANRILVCDIRIIFSKSPFISILRDVSSCAYASTSSENVKNVLEGESSKSRVSVYGGI